MRIPYRQIGRAKTEEPIELLSGKVDGGGPKESCISLDERAYCRHLAKTIERSSVWLVYAGLPPGVAMWFVVKLF